MSHWMFNCKEVSLRVSTSLDHKLPLQERLMIAMHLAMCRYCSRFKKQLLLIRSALWEDGPPAADTPETPLPRETAGRIKKLLRDRVGKSSAAP